MPDNKLLILVPLPLVVVEPFVQEKAAIGVAELNAIEPSFLPKQIGVVGVPVTLVGEGLVNDALVILLQPLLCVTVME